MPRKLSEELADIQVRFALKPVTLREVIYRLRGRAYMLLLVLLACDCLDLVDTDIHDAP